MRAHSSQKIHFPWNKEEKLVPYFFFREYNLYFKKILNPFKVVYHPVSCLLPLHICVYLQGGFTGPILIFGC